MEIQKNYLGPAKLRYNLRKISFCQNSAPLATVAGTRMADTKRRRRCCSEDASKPDIMREKKRFSVLTGYNAPGYNAPNYSAPGYNATGYSATEDDDTTNIASPPRSDSTLVLIGEACNCVQQTRDRVTTAAAAAMDKEGMQRLPLEIMTMIAKWLDSPCDAHNLSRVSKSWNAAFKLAFPNRALPRFIVHAIYTDPGRLGEVERIEDNGLMMSLCTIVNDPVQLVRLARPATLDLYSACFKKAAHALNREALTALIIYGKSQEPADDWVLSGCIHTINAFFSAPVYNQSAPAMFYETVAKHASDSTFAEVVRTTVFRRFGAGIECILDMRLPLSDDLVRMLMQTTATMSEQLLLSVLEQYPEQTGAFLSSDDNHANTVSIVVRSGWMDATEKILSLVASTAQNSVLMLRYAVLANKSALVNEILFPRRRSSRKRLRSSLTHHHPPSPNVPILTADDEGILREAITLGHEEIAMMLCRAAPWIVSAAVVVCAIRAGHRSDFVDYLMRCIDPPKLEEGAELFAKTAVAFKNYEVVALLISKEHETLTYTRETLLSFLNLLGPFKGFF